MSTAALVAATVSTACRVQPLSSTRRAGPESTKPTSRKGASWAALISDSPITWPAAVSAAIEVTDPSAK